MTDKTMIGASYNPLFVRPYVPSQKKPWPKSTTLVESFCKSLLQVTGASKRYPAVVQMLNGWLRCILPAAWCCSWTMGMKEWMRLKIWGP